MGKLQLYTFDIQILRTFTEIIKVSFKIKFFPNSSNYMDIKAEHMVLCTSGLVSSYLILTEKNT